MGHVTTRPKRSVLILWDIDHTLLTIGKISREIYEMAFQEVVGRPLRELADMAGRTEQAIIVETLMLHGVSEPESKFDRFYAALAEAADELRERMCAVGRRLPGAAEAIAALADDDVVQTVVTGNLKPIALTKLEVFGLLENLDVEIGGYGSDGSTRPPLIRKAWRQGGDKYHRRFDAHRVLIIGDTPHDIVAAHEVGVQALGVATGDSTVEELTTAEADEVLADLADTGIVVQAVYRVLGP